MLVIRAECSRYSPNAGWGRISCAPCPDHERIGQGSLTTRRATTCQMALIPFAGALFVTLKGVPTSD